MGDEAAHAHELVGAQREVEIGFKTSTTNDDGLIDFGEFVAWWTED
ncbi:MAG: hypothetical protein HC793_03735 [Aquincola sp.]|nr:hypothetical protein [Aquincola sp.]